ncbi:hypothetical protein [Natrinema sp. SYSU A 869]|uniref:hypothetical protein n=1 Tax=Natrinema sp. SYSU A 869 TaxID=2871694 RepID=UPI001CA46714|nr:hypothetical protein [Natrinema sp. SYSU A 869]
MESVSTRLDNETLCLIRETAEERSVSMAEVLRELVEKGLEYTDLEIELVEYIEREQSISERKAQAGIVTRAKWFVIGMPTEEAE